jgi:hypothetical protein
MPTTLPRSGLGTERSDEIDSFSTLIRKVSIGYTILRLVFTLLQISLSRSERLPLVKKKDAGRERVVAG